MLSMTNCATYQTWVCSMFTHMYDGSKCYNFKIVPNLENVGIALFTRLIRTYPSSIGQTKFFTGLSLQ